MKIIDCKNLDSITKFIVIFSILLIAKELAEIIVTYSHEIIFIITIFMVLFILNKFLNIQKVVLQKTIKDVDDLPNGYAFQEFLKDFFEIRGYHAVVSKKSGDMGGDIIIAKGNIRTSIQTKLYSSSVGVSAIQEVYASLNYYNCSKGIVITNNYFTKPAKQLAKVNGVELWDRDKLIMELAKNNSLSFVKCLLNKIFHLINISMCMYW